MIKYITLLFLFISTHSSSIEPVNKNLNLEATELLNYLESIYNKKVLSGYNVFSNTPDIYEQTGQDGAVWGRDLRWIKNPYEIVSETQDKGYILTIHWHWYFNKESAWKSKRTKQVDISKVLTVGSEEHNIAMRELKLAADKLEILANHNIPVLWRPFHEIDGGWFWWNDPIKPENSANLWKMMYEYFVNVRQLNNLIWVYSASIADIPLLQRKLYYPGESYVDISGIDIYSVKYKTDIKRYNHYFDIMSEVSPGKMLALAEADAIPNPDLMANGETPKWLYVLPWWGAPYGNKRPLDWALTTLKHPLISNLKDIPALKYENIKPNVGITSPLGLMESWHPHAPPVITTYANDRDGFIESVALYANDLLIESKSHPPFNFTWKKDKSGSYKIHVIAIDNVGGKSKSNSIYITVGKEDAAKDKKVTTSSGNNGYLAVDQNMYTSWGADKSDSEWIYIDLESEYSIDSVNLHWGWKIHPTKIQIEIATDSPNDLKSWKAVYKQENITYQPWKGAQLINFPAINGRYVKLRAFDRAAKQTWGGFQLTSFTVPVKTGTVKKCVWGFVCMIY